MANVLFICLGNMCRSPMAEYFFNRYTKISEAKSAGLAASWESEEVKKVMKEKGIDMGAHKVKQLDEYLIDWADIVVCSDHCSTIFEPMILGKKVVAVEGKHIPKYKEKHSPLKYSSVKYITSAREFDLNSIPNVNPEDPVTNRICWGNHGKADLAKLFLEKVEEVIEGFVKTGIKNV